MDGILQPGSTPASSIPVKASLLGSPTIGQFRREFRNFFSRYVLVSTHRITDAFAQIEKMSSDATLKAKGPRKARSPAGPTIAKSPNRPEVVEQQLRYALRMQGFSPKPIRGAVAHLKSRIDNGETLAILLVDAIQFLTPEAATKK